MQLEKSFLEPPHSDAQRPTPSVPQKLSLTDRKPPQKASGRYAGSDPILTVEDVACRLNVSKDWVWDNSSRKTPRLPVIRMGDGTLRYRASAIEDFICERERATASRIRSR